MSKLKILAPTFNVIEKTALEFAAVYYEAGRSSGMTSKYKNARAFARANVEKFIPKAVDTLIGMLGRQDLPDLMKMEIYDALQERMNDPDLNESGAFKEMNPFDYKSDHQDKPQAVIINTTNPFKKVN